MKFWFLLASLLVCPALLFPALSLAEAGSNTRISLSPTSVEGDGASSSIKVSQDDDSRYLVFASSATNLVSSDTNGVSDIFLYDRQTSTMSRISIASDDTQADGASFNPSVSNDGRYVVFESDATNLVSSDTGGLRDCFLRDRTAGTTVRVNLDSNGNSSNAACANPSVSDSGSLVAFESSATDLVTTPSTGGNSNIYIRNISGSTNTLITPDTDGNAANGNSNRPFISAEGNYVVFDSVASDLVATDTNGVRDVFLYSGSIATISKNGTTQGNGTSSDAHISHDSGVIVFTSTADNLVAGDTTNAFADCFMYDLSDTTIRRISVSSAGAEADGACSSPRAGGGEPSIYGRYVAFVSAATNLDSELTDSNGVNDIYVARYKANGVTTRRISLGTSGVEATGGANSGPYLGLDNNILVWTSAATNLVSSDGNGVTDVFLTENDTCPASGDTKTNPGACGCLVPDTDTDSDGALDCREDCDTDPNKTVAGACGCGTLDDADGDGYFDCECSYTAFPRVPEVQLHPNGYYVVMHACTDGLYRFKYYKLGVRPLKVYQKTTRKRNYGPLKHLTNGRWRIKYQFIRSSNITPFSGPKTFIVREIKR